MHGVRLIPRNLAGKFVESRAEQIQDPVQRLRYLQTSMGSVTGQPVLHAARYWRARRFAVVGLALLFGCLLIPKYKASSGGKASLAPPPIAHASGAAGARGASAGGFLADAIRQFFGCTR